MPDFGYDVGVSADFNSTETSYGLDFQADPGTPTVSLGAGIFMKTNIDIFPWRALRLTYHETR